MRRTGMAAFAALLTCMPALTLANDTLPPALNLPRQTLFSPMLKTPARAFAPVQRIQQTAILGGTLEPIAPKTEPVKPPSADDMAQKIAERLYGCRLTLNSITGWECPRPYRVDREVKDSDYVPAEPHAFTWPGSQNVATPARLLLKNPARNPMGSCSRRQLPPELFQERMEVKCVFGHAEQMYHFSLTFLGIET